MADQKKQTKKWSQAVTKHSRALVLEEGVFTWKSPKKIAKSLQQSALKSKQRKGTPLQSAMSMLNFYINRAGKTLDSDQKKTLEQAKIELRSLFRKRSPPLKRGCCVNQKIITSSRKLRSNYPGSS